MSVKELIEKAPELCGAKHAEKLKKVAKLVWDAEKANAAFKREEGESALERIEFLFDFSCADEKKKEYCKRLCELNVLAHYAAEHDDKASEILATELKQELLLAEPQYPDVAQVLSVESAARGWWGD